MATNEQMIWVTLRGDIKDLSSKLGKAQKQMFGFSKAANQVTKNVSSAFALIGTAFVATKAIQGINNLTRGLVEAGDKILDLKEAYSALGGSVAVLNQAKTASEGLLKTSQLLTSANELLVRGVAGVNEHFAALADYAGRFAQATGRDTAEVLNEITASVSGGKAAAMAKFGVFIADMGSKGKNAAAGLAAIPKALESLPAVTVGAAEAVTQMDNAISAAYSTVAQKVAGSEGIKEAFQGVADAINAIDWEVVGQNVAELVTQLARAAGWAGEIFAKLTGSSKQGTDEKTARMYANTKLGGGVASWGVSDMGLSESHPQYAAWKKFYEEGLIKAKELRTEEAKLGDTGNKAGEATANAMRRAANETDKAGDKAEKAAKKFKDEWWDKVADVDESLLKKSISNAIDLNDEGSFRARLDEMKTMLASKLEAGWAQAKASGIPRETFEKFNETQIQIMSSEYWAEWQDKGAQTAIELAEKQKDAFRDSVDFFSDIFSEAIDTGTLDLDRMMKQVVVGFASNLAASMTGFSLQGGFSGLGGSLAQSMMGGGGGGGMMSMGGAALGGAIGTGAFGTTVGGSFLAGVTGTATVPASAAASSALTAGSYVAAAAPYVAAAAAVYMAAQKFGWIGHKPQNPDTKARKQVESFLENKLGRDVKFGSIHRFDQGKGFENFQKLSGDTQNYFNGLGEGLKGVLGITEDVGPQIAAILADDLNGSLSAAKGLFAELGVSAEEMAQAVIAAGIKAGKTWAEIQASLEKVDALTTPGRPGQGDVAGAIQDLIASGGIGMEAIVAIQDAVRESTEKGITSLDAFRAELSKIMPEDQVSIIFQALDQRGIKTFDQLKEAGERTFIAIVASLDNLGFKFDEVTKKAETFSDTMGKTGAGSGGEDVPKFAAGGVATRATLGIFGEAGPEAIMPLTRRNGKLGIRAYGMGGGGGGYTINIDARGAEAGVEHKIRAMLEQMESRVVNKAITVVSEHSRRGGY